MGDAFVADLASGLVCKLVSLATDEVIQAWHLHDDLITLRERLECIDALLSDAYTKKIAMSFLQNWLNKLQAVAHVADVLMDELAYEATRRKVENSHKVRDFFIPSKNTILYRFKLAHKIKSILASFDRIFKMGLDLGIQPVAHLGLIVQTAETGKTPPSENMSLIVGRDKDISSLVQMVCKNYEEELQVIAVVGMGGQGKTTLARMVYKEDDIINRFPKRMWVTVSYEFDFMKILNEMVESLTSTISALTNTEGLIKELQRHLKGVRFLLILDNVWNEKPEEWEKLRNSLLDIDSAKESIILVTTRKQEVIDAMPCSVSYPVDKLSKKDSWELFEKITFSRGVSKTETFEALGRSMLERCGGLPLAIKTLGGLLRSKSSEEEWRLIKDSETWKSKDVLPVVRLSYDNLPYSSLKRCFAYCSIMQKDSNIYKDELIQIWMALGFLLPRRGSHVLMEDIGNEYFNILLWNSLLQDVTRNEDGTIRFCRMHDLVHDLALDISMNYSKTLKAGNELKPSSGAIYLRLDKGVSDIKPRNFERVQILYVGARFLGDVLPYLKHLTVLVLNTGEVTYDKLPSTLQKMKYLKHLDISSFCSRLPGYIMKLYNLLTLRVSNLEGGPNNFSKLINLRHLVVKDTYYAKKCMFIGLQRLTCLQTLPCFVVSRDQNCLLRQLGGLDNLRGRLNIYGLGDVANIEEASKAKLCNKSAIQHLLLNWSNNVYERQDRDYNDEDVMEGLKPHTNLELLIIDNFKGTKFATWVTMMTNLVEVRFRHCHRCEILPNLGHLPKLREIKIVNMGNVRVIGSNFYGAQGRGSSEFSVSGSAKTITTMYPSLTELRLCNLPKLEEWIDPVMSIGGEDQFTALNFPRLEVLSVLRCSNLTRILNSCFPSLKRLIIEDSESSMILETLSRKVSSLTHLELKKISDREGGSFSCSSNMDSIMDELLKNNSMSLTTLELDDCQGLTSLTLGVALEELSVGGCPDLTSINVVQDSIGLKGLMLTGCPKYEIFP